MKSQRGKYLRTEKHRIKMSESQKGKKLSEEHKRKLKIARKGKKPSLGKRWKLSEEIRRKMSLSSRGKPKAEEHKRKLSLALKGKKRPPFSKEWRENLSKALIGKSKGKENALKSIEKIRKSLSGDKNPSWLGGKSFEPYSLDWKETLKRAIRERDNYICQLCSQYGFFTHHIDYNKKNCNTDNLITLCNSCHSKTNFNREYYKNYFTKICTRYFHIGEDGR